MHDLPMGRVGASSGRRREAKRIKVITDGLKTAWEAGVSVYLSNESFEVWLLAHAISVPKRAGKRAEATRLALKQGLLDDRRKKEVVADVISANSIRKALLEVKRLRKEYGGDVLRVKPMTDVDKIVEKVELLR